MGLSYEQDSSSDQNYVESQLPTVETRGFPDYFFMKENIIHIDPIEQLVETHYLGKVRVDGLTLEFVLTEETTFFNSDYKVKVLWGEGGVDATIKDKILDLIDKEVELFIKSKSKK